MELIDAPRSSVTRATILRSLRRRENTTFTAPSSFMTPTRLARQYVPLLRSPWMLRHWPSRPSTLRPYGSSFFFWLPTVRLRLPLPTPI